MNDRNIDNMQRRKFLRDGLWGGCFTALAAGAAAVFARSNRHDMVWQIDPHKCIACGKCATTCVLNESAVKCVHAYAMCGYCDLCTGYFVPEPKALTTAAENQLCPLGAINRTYVEDPYFEYTIDETLCNGCGKCVKGCGAFGNGSLFLQIRHDRCANCNECAIELVCPSQAIKRLPVSKPYIIKGQA